MTGTLRDKPDSQQVKGLELYTWGKVVSVFEFVCMSAVLSAMENVSKNPI